MAVKRIVADIATDDPKTVAAFYQRLFGLKIAMDQGWIITLMSSAQAVPQISFASEGGSGTPVPDLSIEVDDLDDVYSRAVAEKLDITYGPTDEPWCVRRFFVRDPTGRTINVLSHKKAI
ncbi:MAG: VOC family protein [Geminicoccaceae bacterium]